MLYRTENQEYVVVNGSFYVPLKPKVWNYFVTPEEFNVTPRRSLSTFDWFALGWLDTHRGEPIPCIRRTCTIPVEDKYVHYNVPNAGLLPRDHRGTAIPAGWRLIAERWETGSPVYVYQNSFGDHFMVFGMYYVPLISERCNYLLRPDEFEGIKGRVSATFAAFAKCWMQIYPQRPIPAFVSNYSMSANDYVYAAPVQLMELSNGVPDSWTFIKNIQ